MERKFESLEKATMTLKRSLQESQKPPFSPAEFMVLYSTAFDMCTSINGHSQRLYDLYKQVLVDYINEDVLPALRQKQDDDEVLVGVLAKMWSNYKLLVRWLVRIFQYLDRLFVPWRQLASLNEVGFTCFRDMVYHQMSSKFKDAALGLIRMDREGRQIDRSLLKDVICMFVEMSKGEMDRYENDFEEYFMRDTTTYYSRKASRWIVEYSCPEYMLKAEECLEKEKDRVTHYLQGSSEEELMERVRHELLLVYVYQLLEKEDSGCRALLKEGKVEDLSRMYRLYSQVPQGLSPMARIFKKYISAEITALLACKAQDTTGGSQFRQAFVREVIELHDKFTTSVVDCFGNHSSFHKAVNKGVADHTSAQLLATFCDSILKKGGEENLSDEAIEVYLEKVVELLACVTDIKPFCELYRKKLSSRMEYSEIANVAQERSMIMKLKQLCDVKLAVEMDEMLGKLSDFETSKRGQWNTTVLKLSDGVSTAAEVKEGDTINGADTTGDIKDEADAISL